MSTALLAGCYALVNPSRTQCDNNTDCQTLTGSNTVCVNHLCVATDAGTPDAGATDAAASDGFVPVADSGIVADAGIVLPGKPIAYWPMDTADIEGTTLKDRAGTTNGTIVGAISDSSGRVGQALSFDGDGQFITFGDVLDDLFAGPDNVFTLSIWFKPADLSVTRILLAKNSDDTCPTPEDNRAIYLGFTNARRFSVIYQLPAAISNQSTQIIASKKELADTEVWVHLVVTYDGTADAKREDRVRFYIDGVRDISTVLLMRDLFPFDLVNTAAHLALGARVSSDGQACTSSGPQAYMGLMDEVALWNRALTDEEAAGLYAQGMAGQPLYSPDTTP